PVEHVLGYGRERGGPLRLRAALREPGADAVLAHEAGDPVLPAGDASGLELGVDAERAVGPAALAVDRADRDEQAAISPCPLALRPRPPAVVAARRHAERLAHG